MGLIGIFICIVALILIGIGIGVGLVACGIAAVLLGLGVLSSSFVIGLRSRRASSGIRAFLLQCGVIAGIPAGAVCAWLAKSFFEALQPYGGDLLVMLYGAIGGAVAGVVVALMLDYITRRFHGWASARFLPAEASPPPSLERGGQDRAL